MSEIPSSGDGENYKEIEYETLEEYIFSTERDMEDEIPKQMRLRDWQKMQLDIIKRSINTNSVEVVARSYLMGLARLRDNHADDVDRLNEMLVEFLKAAGMDPDNEKAYDKTVYDISEFSIPENHEHDGGLTNPKEFKIQRSAVSEVEDTYIEDALFGPWIHRYVATLGFLDSEVLNDVTEEKLSSFSAYVDQSMDEAVEGIESLIEDYIALSQAKWVCEGVDKEVHKKLQDVVELMQTDRKEACRLTLERSQDLINQREEGEDNEDSDE